MTTETTSSVRTVDGAELPVAGTWVLDPTHTSVEFVARHMMVTKVRGRFNDISGSVELGEDPADTTVTIEVDLASVASGTEDRDNHLRSADFFDVEQFPKMTFRSTSLERNGSGWKLNGELDLHGVTHPLTLDAEFHGVVNDPWGNAKAQVSASGEVNREDFGLTWNVPLESGGILVSKTAKIEIEAQFAQQA